MKKELQTLEISQIHRLIGQLQGVEKMMAKNLPTSKIIQQIEAVKGNLKTLEKRILGLKIKDFSDEELKKALNYLIKLS